MTKLDGIAHPKKRAFLAAYSECGIITAAVEAAQVARASHYVWMEHDEEYALAFTQAKEVAIEHMEAEARRRAVAGVNEPVIYQGKLQGVWVDEEGQTVSAYTPGATQIPLTIKKYSDTLLIFMLKAARPEKYRDRGPVLTAQVGDKEKGVTLVFGPGEDVP